MLPYDLIPSSVHPLQSSSDPKTRVLTASKEIDGVKNHYSADPSRLIPVAHLVAKSVADPGGQLELSRDISTSSSHILRIANHGRRFLKSF